MSENEEIKRGLRSQYPEIREEIITAYEQNLKRSRSHWTHDARFSFPYSQDIVGGHAIAYDVKAIPTRLLGRYFVQLLYDPPLEANSPCKPRKAIRTGQGFETLMHELPHQLIPDPLNETLAVVPNRWPRAAYHCLLLSREWRPQRLAPEFIQAQLEWAARGFVVMFHRRGVLLNHFHMHIFMPETAPISRFASSFRFTRKHAGLEEGTLQDYPVPCIALASEDLKVLYQAITLMVNQLDAKERWFNQVVLLDPEHSKVIALFFLWPDVWMDGFYFDPIGLVRSADAALTEDRVVAEVQRAHTHGQELQSVRDIYWNAWETAGSLDMAEIVRHATRALQGANAGWAHANHQALTDEDLRQVFALYATSYAETRWAKFKADDQDSGSTAKSLSNFRRFYHHAFLLRDAEGHIVAFILGKDTPFGVKFCLGGTDGSSLTKAVFVQSLFSLIEVNGVYAEISGRMREIVLNNCGTALSMRMLGQPARVICPVVNPRLASYLLGIETAMDADGVHCYWQYFLFPETKKTQSTRILVVGNPILGSGVVQPQEILASVGDSFLICQWYEHLMAQWESGALAGEEVYRCLTALLENENLFTAGLDRDKLARCQESANSVVIDELLEVWRQKVLKVRILAALYRISNIQPSLESPSGERVAQADSELVSCEEALAGLPRLKDEPIARELARFSEEAKDALAKSGRVVLTQRFRDRHPVVTEGRMQIVDLLLSRLQNTGGGVIGIGGPSGVGKSTFAGYINDRLGQGGQKAIIVPTDAFLRPRQEFQSLRKALHDGQFEQMLWDMDAYYNFLGQVSDFRQSNQPTVQILIADYYNRLTKERTERSLCLTKETVVIVEGSAAVNSRSRRYFDVTVTIDVRDDQIILDNLLKRLPEAKPEREAYIKERFFAADRPYAACLVWAGRYLDYDYVLDNSEFDRPILYSTRDSMAQIQTEVLSSTRNGST